MVNNNWDLILSSGKNFNETFPSIKSALIEVIESGDGVGPSLIIDKPYGYSLYDLKKYTDSIPCSNPCCTGGPSVYGYLCDAVKSRLEELSFSIKCTGNTKRGPCMNYFKATLRITYID